MSEKLAYKKEVQLSMPVCAVDKDGKETIVEKLVLGRIKLKALKDMPPGSLDIGGSYTSIIPLIAASANLPLEIVEEIDLIDLRAITEAVEPFLPKSPKTGTN